MAKKAGDWDIGGWGGLFSIVYFGANGRGRREQRSG